MNFPKINFVVKADTIGQAKFLTSLIEHKFGNKRFPANKGHYYRFSLSKGQDTNTFGYNPNINTSYCPDGIYGITKIYEFNIFIKSIINKNCYNIDI
jgi:hypothetical protein